MKKKCMAALLAAAMAFGLAACGSSENSGLDSGTAAQQNTATQQNTAGQESTAPQEEPGTQEAGANIGETAADTEDGTQAEQESILIAYSSIPEDIDTDGIDADAGASIVVKDEQVMGNLEYTANVIWQTVGGDLFRIETVEQYPLEHEALVDQAAEEQDADARPALAVQIENVEQYDTIFLGYPNWWGDMPMPLYTFLEEYDFSGKTIIPFTVHGGSGFSDTVSTIAELQPNAQVSEDGLSISRNSVADAEAEIISWAEGVGL